MLEAPPIRVESELKSGLKREEEGCWWCCEVDDRLGSSLQILVWILVEVEEDLEEF